MARQAALAALAAKGRKGTAQVGKLRLGLDEARARVLAADALDDLGPTAAKTLTDLMDAAEALAVDVVKKDEPPTHFLGTIRAVNKALRACPRINALKLQGGAPPARSWNPTLYLDTARFRGRVGGDASAANSVRLFSYRP